MYLETPESWAPGVTEGHLHPALGFTVRGEYKKSEFAFKLNTNVIYLSMFKEQFSSSMYILSTNAFSI